MLPRRLTPPTAPAVTHHHASKAPTAPAAARHHAATSAGGRSRRGAPRRSVPALRQELARSSPAGYGGSPARSSPVSHGASLGGAHRSARPPAPPLASPSLWQVNLLVITPNCRGKLVSLGRVSDGAGGKLRFSAPVAVFGSREQDSRVGVRCSGREAVLATPLARIHLKQLPEPEENPCQTDPKHDTRLPVLTEVD
jgi:hypothetical protein